MSGGSPRPGGWPHVQVGERRLVPDCTCGMVAPHQDWQAATACGQLIHWTLVTREQGRARCLDCVTASTPRSSNLETPS